MALAMEPRRPAGGAFGQFLAERRESIRSKLPATSRTTDVVRAASQLWRALGDDDRRCYEQQYSAKVEAYRGALADYEAQGGARAFVRRGPAASRRRKGATTAQMPVKIKRRKRPHPNAPKRPAVGGAYGIFVTKIREEVVRSIRENNERATAATVARACGQRWKVLPDEEKKEYEQEYRRKLEEFKKAMLDFASAGKIAKTEYVAQELGESTTGKHHTDAQMSQSGNGECTAVQPTQEPCVETTETQQSDTHVGDDNSLHSAVAGVEHILDPTERAVTAALAVELGLAPAVPPTDASAGTGAESNVEQNPARLQSPMHVEKAAELRVSPAPAPTPAFVPPGADVAVEEGAAPESPISGGMEQAKPAVAASARAELPSGAVDLDHVTVKVPLAGVSAVQADSSSVQENAETQIAEIDMEQELSQFEAAIRAAADAAIERLRAAHTKARKSTHPSTVAAVGGDCGHSRLGEGSEKSMAAAAVGASAHDSDATRTAPELLTTRVHSTVQGPVQEDRPEPESTALTMREAAGAPIAGAFGQVPEEDGDDDGEAQRGHSSTKFACVDATVRRNDNVEAADALRMLHASMASVVTDSRAGAATSPPRAPHPLVIPAVHGPHVGAQAADGIAEGKMPVSAADIGLSPVPVVGGFDFLAEEHERASETRLQAGGPNELHADAAAATSDSPDVQSGAEATSAAVVPAETPSQVVDPMDSAARFFAAMGSAIGGVRSHHMRFKEEVAVAEQRMTPQARPGNVPSVGRRSSTTPTPRRGIALEAGATSTASRSSAMDAVRSALVAATPRRGSSARASKSRAPSADVPDVPSASKLKRVARAPSSNSAAQLPIGDLGVPPLVSDTALRPAERSSEPRSSKRRSSELRANAGNEDVAPSASMVSGANTAHAPPPGKVARSAAPPMSTTGSSQDKVKVRGPSSALVASVDDLPPASKLANTAPQPTAEAATVKGAKAAGTAPQHHSSQAVARRTTPLPPARRPLAPPASWRY